MSVEGDVLNADVAASADQGTAHAGAALNLVTSHVVGRDVLSSIAYIPNYVSPTDEARLLERVCGSKQGWTQVSGRQLQNHGGVVHKGGLLQAALPAWLQQITQRLHQDTGLFGGHPPNHVLINSYHPGEGILPHEDGPAYWPEVAIISLGAPAIIRFYKKPEEGAPNPDDLPAASVLLMPRSLLVFSAEAYTHCLHGIRQVEEELVDSSVVNLCSAGIPDDVRQGGSVPRGGVRVSMTVRRVVKVVKNMLRLAAT